MDRRNFIAFACGMKGSGKTVNLSRYAARFPRRIVFDNVAEFYGKIPGAYECVTYRQTLDALEDAATKRQWVIVCSPLPSEAAKIAGILAPLSNPMTGYSVAVGGVLVEAGEIDIVAPNHKGAPAEILNLFHRGRHALVSIAAGSRRPADVNKIVTSQADVILCFKQHEAGDILYLSSVIGESAAREVSRLDRWEHILYVPQTGYTARINKDGKTAAVL